MGQLTVFAGGFGSGKSEIAINHALGLCAQGQQALLADLDLVNPYFASREVKTRLESQGIHMIAPRGDLSFGDVPSVPGEILGMLQQDQDMVIDLAGDEVGSLVLGYLSTFIQKGQDMAFYLVVNPYRPFAYDVQSLAELKDRIEAAAHINFTAVVSNPNLVEETSLDIIRRGHEKVMALSEGLGLPVAYLTVEDRFYPALFGEYGSRLRALRLYLRPNWL